MKKGLILIAVLLIILIVPLCFTSSNLKLDKQVTEQFGKGNVKVIVVMNDVSKQISSAGISEQKIRHKFSSFNGFSSELSEDEIKQLADNPSVKAIYYDTPVHIALQESAPLINATLAWTKQVNGINITGKGLSACVIDTGVNYSHPDLGNCSRQFYVMNGTNISYVLESPHNYTNGNDTIWKINYTNFSNIAVHFANISLELRNSTSDNLDRIRIYDYQMREIADYHGNGSIIKDFWTPFSNNDTIYVRLTTDSNITDYGFYIDQIRNGTTNTTFDWRNCSKVIGGWDFVNNDADPYDDNGHGTHVSGIIAANGKIKGIAPNATIVSAKALNSGGSGYTSDVLYAMEFCINNSEKFNISVISMSIGILGLTYPRYCDYDWPLYVPLINNATIKNISIVIASGNDGDNSGMSVPACLSGVISVGSVNKSDSIASTSNRNNLTTVLAPGVSINSTWFTGGYALDSGTSMATPHVSGEIILLQQAKLLMTNRYNTISEITSLLRNGKNITDSATGLNYTRIDVYQALSAENATDTQVPTYTWISKPNISYGLPVTVNLSAIDDTGITVYNITLNSLSYQMSKSGDNYSYIITPTNLNNITYNVTFKDAVGNTNITDTVVLQINDTLYPSYSNINYQQSYVYNSSAAYYFNSTWSDNIQLSRIWLVFYLNSTKQSNYTASNISSMYNVTLTKLSVGNYSFQWFANDTAGNVNYTDLYNFSIVQSDPSLNLSFNVSGALYYQDIFVENGTFVNISATASAEGLIILYLNDSRINSGLNLISNRSQVNVTVNTTAFYNPTQNYSSSSLTRIINVEASNLAPRGNLISPPNDNYTNNKNVTFKINATDATLKNATLYVWNSTTTSNYSLFLTNTTNITGMYNETNWTYNLSEGYYLWNAFVYDSSGNGNFLAGNNSLAVDTTSPTVALSYSSLSIYTDESASINCTLPSEANLDYLRLYVGGEVKNSSSTPTTLTYTHLGSSGIGTYKINCTAMDKAGNSDTKTQILTVNSRGTTTPPSTGGGGTVTTATNVTPSTETTQTLNQIQADVPANITIPADVAKEGITKITITTLINISSVEISLKKLDSVSVASAGDNVYKYFNISAKNLNESSIKNVSIDFEVTQNWISSNNLNKSTVKLKRYKDVWTDLNTEQISEDSDKAYFRAETPGFSFFAITAEKNVVHLTTTAGGEEPKTSKKMFMMGIVAVLIIALIAFVWYAFLRKKPSE